MKKSMKDSFGNFMAGKGFYIVLLLCVAALGVSGYYLFSGMSKQTRPVSGPVTVVVTPTPRPTPTAAARETPTPPSMATPLPKPTPAPVQTAAPVATPAASAPPTATATVYTWPVKGEILRDHDLETLAYDRTMADWRTHDGIDIACPPGTQVLAPAGGTVSDIYEDDLMGKTVVITHADGVASVCANLAEPVTVEIGDTVRTGAIIGAVGTSAIAESQEGSHLHLAMTKDGVSVDPRDYLPKQ